MFPVIFGLAGKTLTPDEISFLKEADPAGIILFARNVDNPDQVHGLTDSVRQALGRDLLVLVDQEGGRVQRLAPPHWRAYPPMAFFGKAYAKNPEVAGRALYLNTALIACDLGSLGINVDCLPLLDVPVKGADNVIGDRAFSNKTDVVATLGQVVCDALTDHQVLPVVKHIPGHGRATVDSHEKLPIVDTPLNDLEATDFAPFKALNDQIFGMTAHVVYTSVDPENPATLSKKAVNEVIRGTIGFEGLLISDDINMKALSGSPSELAEKCLAAGIDLVLHCNGDLAEMQDVMRGLKPMVGAVESKIKQALSLTEGLFADQHNELLEEYQQLEQKIKQMDDS